MPTEVAHKKTGVGDKLKVSTWVVRGEEIDVFYDGRQFLAEYGSSYYRDSSEDRVVDKLKTVTRRARIVVDVPVSRVTSRGGAESIQHGVLTGKHGGNGNVLVEWDDGRKDQLDRYGSRNPLYRRLTNEEGAVLLELIANERFAHNALKAFIGATEIDPNKKVDQAIQAKIEVEDGDPT